MNEDLKQLRDINKDDINSWANLVKSVEDEDDVFLATNDEIVKIKWVMNFAASKHICRDREMFDTLKTGGEFSHSKLGNGEKMKVEGTGAWGWSSMMMLFKLSQMWGLYLLLLSIWFLWGRWHHKGTSMLVQSRDARSTMGDTWCCEDKKIKVTFAIWMDKPWRRTMKAKWRRKWSFLMLWKCWEILLLEGEFVHFQID